MSIGSGWVGMVGFGCTATEKTWLQRMDGCCASQVAAVGSTARGLSGADHCTRRYKFHRALDFIVLGQLFASFRRTTLMPQMV